MMKRVEMRSPATSGTALVPEALVQRYAQRGWTRVQPKAEKAPAKKSASKKSESDD